MQENGYSIERFVEDMRSIVSKTDDEASILTQIAPLAKRAAADRTWLKAEMYKADPELGFGSTLLHAESDNSLFIVVDSWLPGRGVSPHNHGTWAVVVAVDGPEKNIFWQRQDDSSRDGYAELQQISEKTLSAGEVITMPTDAIHSVINETDQTTLSFHVYGKHLNYTERSQFNPEKNIELPFIITVQ